ncbi:YetF domain-containing protein, partial [Leifsonia sp. SIMBA_070]
VDIEKVSLALWEPDGTISLFLDPQYKALTPADMHIATKAFTLPKTIIKEGKIDFKELNQDGKDEVWLKKSLKMTYNADV